MKAKKIVEKVLEQINYKLCVEFVDADELTVKLFGKKMDVTINEGYPYVWWYGKNLKLEQQNEMLMANKLLRNYFY